MGMPDREQVEMMRRCEQEIVQLRAVIDGLRPKAEAYDNISAVISIAIPRRSQGAGEDVAWLLRKKISEIEAELAAAKAPAKAENEEE